MAEGRVRTAAWVFASYALAILGAIAIQVLLTRTQSVELVGRLAVAIAIAAVFEATVSARGAETALTLFADRFHKDPTPPPALTRELLVVDALWHGGATLLFLACVLIWAGLGHADLGLLVPLGLAVSAQCAWGVCKSLQTVYSPIERQTQTELMVNVVGFAVQGAMIVAWGVAGYAWGAFAAGLWKSAVALVVLAPRMAGAGRKPLFAETSRREYLRLGGFGLVRSFATYLAAQIDILLLALTAGPAAVAYYRTARSVANAPGKALTPIWTLARKTILGGMRHDTIGHARGRIVLIALGFLAAAAPGVIALLFWGGPILAAVFGKPYAAAAPALVILFAGNWVLTVCTGWARFAASVAPKKTVTTLAFVSQSAICAGLWALIRPMDAAAMAWIATGASLVTAAAFWAALWRQEWLVGRAQP